MISYNIIINSHSVAIGSIIIAKMDYHSVISGLWVNIRRLDNYYNYN